MSKNNNAKSAPVSLAAIQTEREKLAAQIAALDAKEGEVKQQTFAKLGEFLDTLPGAIGKITGQTDVKVADVISFLKSREKGTLGSLVSTRATGDTTVRLTEEQRKNLSADMLARAVARKQGKSATQISELCAKYNCSAATVNGYAPTEAELAAAMPAEVAAQTA